MKIIQGRGHNRRTIIELPTGDFVRRAPVEEQVAVHAFMCRQLGVTPNVTETTA